MNEHKNGQPSKRTNEWWANERINDLTNEQTSLWGEELLLFFSRKEFNYVL